MSTDRSRGVLVASLWFEAADPPAFRARLTFVRAVEGGQEQVSYAGTVEDAVEQFRARLQSFSTEHPPAD